MVKTGRILAGTLCGLGLAFLLGSLIFLRSAQKEEPPLSTFSVTSVTAPSKNSFVGQSACAECHAGISELYKSHPMSRSMSSLEQPGFEESDHRTSFRVGPSLEYVVERNGGTVWHHEICYDADQVPIYDQAVETTFSLGSGSRGKGYLIERGDLLFMSPISWYAGKNVWGLSPGYTAERHPRFERRVTDACLSCHAGRVSFVQGEPDRYPAPKFLELSIGCERCHGPGESHIAFHRSADESAGGKVPLDSGKIDPIINPSKLAPRQREAVCNGCHLPLEHGYLRYGQSYHDFRPGQDFDEIVTAFVEANPTSAVEGESRAVSQVMQMRESRCYLASDNRLGCTSCHNPHSVPTSTEKQNYYREQCLKCHATQDCTETTPRRHELAHDSCIACHMPKLAADDVPHTSQTDHRIPRSRVPADSSSVRPLPSPLVTELVSPFDGWDQRLTARDTARAWGLLLTAESEKRSPQQTHYATTAEERLKSVVTDRPDDLEALGSLVSVYLTLNRRPDARQALDQLLKQDPQNEYGLIQMALLLHAEKDWPNSLQYWQRAMQQNPWIAFQHVQHGQTLVKAGRIDEAISAARRAIDLNPGFLAAHTWLAETLPQVGKPDEGEQHRKLISRLKTRPK